MAQFDPTKFVDPDAQAPTEPVGNSEQFNQGFDPSKFVDPDAQPTEPGRSRLEQSVPDSAPKGRLEGAGEAVQDLILSAGARVGPLARLPARAITELLGSQAAKRSLADQALREKKAAAEAEKRSPIASAIGSFTAEAAKFGAVPGGVAGGLLARSATGALAGAGIAAAQTIETDKDLLDPTNLAIGAGTGILGSAAGSAIGKGAQAIARGFGPARRVQQATKGVDVQRGSGLLDEIPLTPSELAPSDQLLRSATRRTFLTKKQARQVQEGIQKRDKVSNDAFRKVLDDVVPEGDDAARATVDKLFSQVDELPVGTQVNELVQNNPILTQALRRVENTPAFGASQLQQGTLGRVRLVKDVLDDDISRLLQAGERKQARNLIKAREAFVNKLDEVAPDFKVARAISQRLNIKEKFVKDLDSIREVSEGAITPEKIFDKFFANKELRNNFLEEVSTAGVDKEAVRKVINTLGVIKKGDFRGILKREPGASGIKSRLSSSIDAGLEIIKQSIGRNEGRALVEVITNPKWTKELGRIKNAQTVESAIQGLGAVLTKASAAEATKE